MKKLSIIIPAYDEAPTIKELLKQVKNLNLKKIQKEIIIVDDASTDGTKNIIKAQTGVKTVYLTKNQGKGAAVRAGLIKATGDYVIIQDADLEYDPRDILKLIKPVLNKRAEVVYGSRFLGPHKNMLFWHLMGNKFLSFLCNLLYNTTLSDMEVCYKLIPTKLARSLNLKQNRFGFDPEITVKVLKQGIRIYEVPISYSGREFHEGKKITWKDGLIVFFLLIYYRFFD